MCIRIFDALAIDIHDVDFITGSQLTLDLHLDLERSEHRRPDGSELGKTLKNACREVAYIIATSRRLTSCTSLKAI